MDYLVINILSIILTNSDDDYLKMKDNILEKFNEKLRTLKELKDWVGSEAFEKIKEEYKKMHLELLLYETFYYKGEYDPSLHWLEMLYTKTGNKEELEKLKKSYNYTPIKSKRREPCIITKNYDNEYYKVLVLKEKGDYGEDYKRHDDFYFEKYIVPHDWVGIKKSPQELEQDFKDWVGNEAFEKIKEEYKTLDLPVALYRTHYHVGDPPKQSEDIKPCIIIDIFLGDEEDGSEDNYKVLVLKEKGDYGKEYRQKLFKDTHVVPHDWMLEPKRFR